ncbi:hypothetical protein ACS0TY_008163 [Phlomoides rotata]
MAKKDFQFEYYVVKKMGDIPANEAFTVWMENHPKWNLLRKKLIVQVDDSNIDILPPKPVEYVAPRKSNYNTEDLVALKTLLYDAFNIPEDERMIYILYQIHYPFETLIQIRSHTRPHPTLHQSPLSLHDPTPPHTTPTIPAADTARRSPPSPSALLSNSLSHRSQAQPLSLSSLPATVIPVATLHPHRRSQPSSFPLISLFVRDESNLPLYIHVEKMKLSSPDYTVAEKGRKTRKAWLNVMCKHLPNRLEELVVVEDGISRHHFTLQEILPFQYSGSRETSAANSTVKIVILGLFLAPYMGMMVAIHTTYQISGAKIIVHDPLPGATQRVVVISGTPDETQATQSLLQAFMVTES